MRAGMRRNSSSGPGARRLIKPNASRPGNILESGRPEFCHAHVNHHPQPRPPRQSRGHEIHLVPRRHRSREGAPIEIPRDQARVAFNQAFPQHQPREAHALRLGARRHDPRADRRLGGVEVADANAHGAAEARHRYARGCRSQEFTGSLARIQEAVASPAPRTGRLRSAHLARVTRGQGRRRRRRSPRRTGFAGA